MAKQNRRDFLKTSAAGAAGIMVAGSKLSPVQAKEYGWYKGRQINPDIDNLRVVCCHDQEIIIGTIGSSFSSQNSAIDTDRVHYDMDLMAKFLAQKNTPPEAWATIFQQPSGKQWSQVKVAIKVNAIYSGLMHHIAIIDKICRELNSLGVPYSNIIIYDGDSSAAGSNKYTPYAGGNGLPSGVIVSSGDNSLGDTTTIQLPNPSNPSQTVNYSCVKDIANGTIDLLINCAVNKGHGSTYGSCTLCMKNHIGTIKYKCPSSVTDLTNINSHDAIIGGTPPRQQLCIMDSILAAKGGPSSSPTNPPPYRIAMGTFGPAVDFLTVKKIREELNNWSHPENTVNKFLTNNDYTEQEVKDLVDLTPDQNNGKGWLEFDPNTVGTIPKKSTSHGKQTLTFTIKGSHFKTVTKKVTFNNQVIKNVSIVDLKGKTIRNLSVPATGRKTIAWNGLNETGKPVRSGKYILNIRSGKSEKAVSFTLQK